MLHMQGLKRNVKNVVKNYSEAQVKVREATSNDPWGPSGTLMSEIADLTYNVVAFTEIMQVVWKRLNDHGKNWKHVYKALVLLDYLIKTGSEKVAQQCKENMYAIETLRDFQYFQEAKDQGVNVREKAKQLVALLKDDERLKNERARALKARERFARSSSALTKQDPLSRHHGSADFTQNSLDEDMLSPGALSRSELDHARPQTVGEEELQLQLALAMSMEEADQAERLKRNDDLRLHLALSESKEEFKKVQLSDKPVMTQSASAVEDLLGLSLNDNVNNHQPAADPWMSPLSPQNNSNAPDPWNTNLNVPEKNQNIVQNDPWSPALYNSTSAMHENSMSKSTEDSSLFDLSGMKKSMSADINSSSVNNSLDSYLGLDSSLINFDSSSRSRTLGNPFQAARPSPMTINELRAQNAPATNGLSSNASLHPSNVSPSLNPFL